VFGAENSASIAAVAADVFDLHQGYLELANQSGSLTATLRAGRQEIALGNERLVGAANWTNTARSFDGARLLLAPGGGAAQPGREPWTATLFAATVEERGAHFGTATSSATTSTPTGSADHVVAGAYAMRSLGGSGALDATVLYDRGGHYRAYDGANRLTVDAHLVGNQPAGLPLRVELEGAVQDGRQRVASTGSQQDVSAWLAGARLNSVPFARRHASVGIGADVLSGDATPTDGRYTAFSTMYATNHPFYGLMDVIGDPAATTKERGLVDAFATGAMAATASSNVKAELHRFTLAAGADRPLGWEADLALPTRVSRAATIELGYSLFRADSGAASVGLGKSGAFQNWLYLQLSVGF
jgi:hypothetical protein